MLNKLKPKSDCLVTEDIASLFGVQRAVIVKYMENIHKEKTIK